MQRFPFKAVRSVLSDIDESTERINWGGCGWMAAIIAYYLKPHVDEMKIVTRGGDTPLDEARKNLEEYSLPAFNDQGVYFNHVWVEFSWRGKWYAADSDGIRSRKAMHNDWGRPVPGSLSLSEIRRLANNPSGWNSWFDRDQVPMMKKIASKGFNSIFC